MYPDSLEPHDAMNSPEQKHLDLSARAVHADGGAVCGDRAVSRSTGGAHGGDWRQRGVSGCGRGAGSGRGLRAGDICAGVCADRGARWSAWISRRRCWRRPGEWWAKRGWRMWSSCAATGMRCRSPTERSISRSAPMPFIIFPSRRGCWEKWRGWCARADALRSVDAIIPERADSEWNDRIERLRDASHARMLTDAGLRELFRAAGLRVIASEVHEREREFDDWMYGAGWAPGSQAYEEVRRQVEASAAGDTGRFRAALRSGERRAHGDADRRWFWWVRKHEPRTTRRLRVVRLLLIAYLSLP